MEPTVKNGQVVLISSLPFLFNHPIVGDIVAFKNVNDEVLLKRISNITGYKVFLKGDNNIDSLDSRQIGWINKKKIIGKIIFK